MKNLLVILVLSLILISSFKAATYYVDATSGNDANSGTSTSSAWKTISKVNSVSFAPGDEIKFKRGEVWRETLIPKTSGTSGHYIYFNLYGTGNKPRILGSNSELTGWANYSGNIWRKSMSTNPKGIFFEKTTDTSNWGYRQTSITNCNGDFKYFWTSSYLYLYATSNPNGYYHAIERPVRDAGAEISKDYIWLDSFEIAYNIQYAIRTTNADFVKIIYSKLHHIGTGIDNSNAADGIYHVSSNGLISHNTIFECGVHGIYSASYLSNPNNNSIIQYNTIYNNYHTHIDIMNAVNAVRYMGGQIIRYNKIYDLNPQGLNDIINPDDGAPGIQIKGNFYNGYQGKVSNTKIYGNIIYKTGEHGIYLSKYCDSTFIYNNTIYYADNAGITIMDDGTYSPQKVWMYNNIISNSKYAALVISSNITNKHINYNLYHCVRDSRIAQIGTSANSFRSLATWRAATPFDDNSISANPVFTNTATYDFTLQTTSPAKNRGTNLVNSSPYFYTKDIIGTSVPKNITDMGHFEVLSLLKETTVISNENENPISYSLSQNYPNPFNPSTKIGYNIPEKSNVNLKIFDLLGAEVVELVNGEMDPGQYDVVFNASGLPSGVYFYRLQAGNFVETRKMILLK